MVPDRPQWIADAAELRRRAEAFLQAHSAGLSIPDAPASLQRLVHELQLHRIELELQNDELRRVRTEVDTGLERFADFYDYSPTGYFTLGRDGAIAQANLAGARLFGLERSRLIGCRFGIFVAATMRTAFDDFLEAVFADGTWQDHEFELANEGESASNVRISAIRSPDRLECRAAVMDISDYKKAEHALRQSEQRFRDVADISADWIWEVDTEGRYTYASASVRALLGYKPDDIIGKTAFDLMPPAEAVRLGKAFADIVGREESFRDLYNIVVDAAGGHHDTLTSGTPIRDAKGKLIGYRGVDRDVTVQKRAEEALRAAQQHIRDLVNSTDGIVWEADAGTFDFTFVSDKAERLLGYSVEEWRQPGFWVEKLHPEDRTWAPAYCAESTARSEPHDFEYRMVAKDGRIIWLHDIVTVGTQNGEPKWIRGIMVDITRRRQAEEELVALNKNLENRVRERARELRRVSAQLTMMEERERRILAEGLHDNLGQLLAVIKIKLTSISDDLPQIPIREIVGLVEQADRAVRSITQELSPPILKTLGLAPALDWLADEMGRLYGLRVHTDLGECSRRLVDEMQAVLYRSARELLINVAKHAGAQDASLTCLCSREEFILVVSDAGIGFVLDDDRGSSAGRTGFGLHSVYERISNIGGRVDIDSSPGNGTTVTLSLPRRIDGKEICSDPNIACR